jgi:RNA polymerase sigma-70 factor, ECF subfamily
VTDLDGTGYQPTMASRAARIDRSDDAPPPVGLVPTFTEVYDQNAAFVWRTLRLFGVEPAQLDDAMQDVFVVVHRRLGEFEARSSLRTWLYAIARRVAQNQRRTVQRRGQLDPLDDELGDTTRRGPREMAERAEAGRALVELIAGLDDDKREVFLLVEVEQLTVPEVADLLGLNLNTVYSRLRAARIAFERAVAARRAREPGGSP